jgi:hypothetical protein
MVSPATYVLTRVRNRAAGRLAEQSYFVIRFFIYMFPVLLVL